MTRKSPPKHGEARCYAAGCRRAECRNADRFARKQRELLHLRGITGHVPGPRVAAHINTLIASGWQRRDIASKSGVSVRAIHYILTGQQKVQRTKALALLALRPIETPTETPATGTARRVQALAAMGWSIQWTATQAGRSPSYIFAILRGDKPTVPREVAEAVAAVCRKYGTQQGASRHTRAIAKRNGWHSLVAWDDIDDPTCTPDVGPADPENRTIIAALRQTEIKHLAAFNVPEHEIADRLGMARNYVHDLIRDMGKAA